jgi:hypothetical protein
MMRRFVHVALFLIGLFGVAAGLRGVDRLPFWSWTRPRLGWLQENWREHDLVFFGSSRVQYGIVPTEFDARLRELGHELRSANGAISGARPHDTNAVVDWLLTQDRGRCRIAVVELHSWARPVADRNWMTDQEIESHAPSEMLRRLRAIAVAKNPLRVKIEQVPGVVAHTLVNLFRIGQGPRIVTDLHRLAIGKPLVSAKLADAGYVDITTTKLESLLQANREWLENHERRQDLERRVRAELPAAQRGGYDVASARGIADDLRAAGILPVFVVMPSFAGNFDGRDGVAALREHEIVIELDDPVAFPELYEVDRWFDQSHLTRSGAERLSRRFAEVFAERVPLAK